MRLICVHLLSFHTSASAGGSGACGGIGLAGGSCAASSRAFSGAASGIEAKACDGVAVVLEEEDEEEEEEEEEERAEDGRSPMNLPARRAPRFSGGLPPPPLPALPPTSASVSISISPVAKGGGGTERGAEAPPVVLAVPG